MDTRFGIRCFAAFLLVWLASSTAHALPTEDPQAHFNRAVELAKDGQYHEAVGLCLGVLDSLEESERARVHKLLGYVYRKLDQQAEAWHHLSLYLQSTGKGDEATADWLREVEAKLKQTRVKVTLTCTENGISLGLEAGASRPTYPCPLIWWFAPGKHVLLANLEGHPVHESKITVRELGDKGIHTIDFPKGPEKTVKVVQPEKTVPAPVVISKPVAPPAHDRTLEWVLMGSGSALVVTGAIVNVLGYARNEDLHTEYESDRPGYDKAYDDEVAPKMTAAYVLYGVGGATLVGGAVMWLLSSSKGSAAEKSTVSFTPLALPGGSGGMLTLYW